MIDPFRGHRIKWTLLLGDLLKSQDYKLNLMLVADPIDFSSIPLERLRDTFQTVTIYHSMADVKREILKLGKDSYLYLFPDLEKYAIWLIRTRVSFKGVFMRPYIEGSGLRFIKIWLGKRLIRFASQFIDSADIRYLSIPYQREHKFKKNWVKDDLTLFEAIKWIPLVEKNMDKFQNTICIPGFLDTRKSIELPIDSLYKFNETAPVKNEILFIGKASQTFKDELLDKSLEGVNFIDSYLNETEYFELIANSQLILLPYSNRGASGIAIEALVFGTPVIIVGNKNWSNLSRKTQHHIRFQPSNVALIASSISKSIKKTRTSYATLLEKERLTNISDFMLNE